MIILKFSNCNKLTGGGKKPLRERHRQNYTRVVLLDHNIKAVTQMTDQQLINNVYYMSGGTISTSATTTVKRIIK